MDAKYPLDQLWQQQSHLVRAFLDIRPRAEKLSAEIAYILEQEVKTAQIEYASVTHRAKTLESFCEKVIRKEIKNPIKEITDFAGVRIVYLYGADRPRLESLIEKELDIVEKVDKVEKAGSEIFGYGALHYLVKLGTHSLGARYDDLKDLICEVQVRTILQDAWAIVAHHLSYKHESDVPKQLRRKLNALAGLFETADDQFNRLKNDRAEYAVELKQLIGRTDHNSAFLEQDINLDNFIEYLQWRLPDRKKNDRETVANLLQEIQPYGYKKFKQLEHALHVAWDAFVAYEQDEPPYTNPRLLTKEKYSTVGVIRAILMIIDHAYAKNRQMQTKALVNARSLVKKGNTVLPETQT